MIQTGNESLASPAQWVHGDTEGFSHGTREFNAHVSSPSPAPVKVVAVLHHVRSSPTMYARLCSSPSAGTFSIPKFGFVFLCLTAVVLTYILWEIKLQRKKTTFIQQVPTVHRDICTLRPISHEESVEEEFLLYLVAWPETPTVNYNYNFETTSDPTCSKFTIIPRTIDGNWLVGDHLEVKVEVKDFYCNPKTSGGDVVLARLINMAIAAGVAGHVVDHLNGTYTALFPLLWKGMAIVEVFLYVVLINLVILLTITLVHPSETITVLRRLTHDSPDRIFFKSFFQSGLLGEVAMCNICLRSTNRELCNYTDVRTGEPWFCLKPKSLSCDARLTHSKGGFLNTLRPLEERLFQSYTNMKVPILSAGRSHVTVYPNYEDKLTVKSRNAEFNPTGFYYNGVWRSLTHNKVHQFDIKSTIQCLKGKVVHMYGDSTIRQWFEYLNTTLPGLREFDLHSQRKIGPYLALDHENNFLVTYRCHGPPIRFGNVKVSELYYIANELDRVAGGGNIVIVIGIWSHFSTFPMEVYIRRLMSIRSAVVRLLARAPETLVVIRTANPKNLKSLYEALTNSDWYSLQRDKALRAVFKGMNVHLVDAWDMVLAHHLPHNLHPDPPIIKNMINVLLSYICPAKGSLIFNDAANLN